MNCAMNNAWKARIITLNRAGCNNPITMPNR